MLVVARERGDRLSPEGLVDGRAARESSNAPVQQVPTNALVEYFRCTEVAADIRPVGKLSDVPGYFRFGGATCFGRVAGIEPAKAMNGFIPEAAICQSGLPFDVSDVVRNLQQECYVGSSVNHAIERLTSSWGARSVYYFLRPLLSVAVRRHLQKIRLSGWERIPFPSWPVDMTVETIMRTALATAARQQGVRKVPFVWFWPDGAQACALMTHDVEGPEGARFCSELMDIDDSYGIKAAFQLVPEGRSGNTRALREQIRGRGFEVNLHDLNHDGYLFDNREQFADRAAQINRYAREFECRGFRSGAMYREQRWFEAFEFSYDMSVPNVAHLEPQRGGCCTVMPYFVGDILELPSTMIQDYSLFYILQDYSIGLWRQQCERILRQNGLMTFITHPDYLLEPRAREVYRQLLGYLRELRKASNVWTTLPGQVDRWWRDRSQMRLLADNGTWRIAGPGSERARLAYAIVDNDSVSYELASHTSDDRFSGLVESHAR
jgi:hypothetical protein